MASIRRFGFTNPVLLDAGLGIIAGHGRVIAASKLELESVPCIRLGDLSEDDRRAYAIADNRIALNSGWDEEMLRTELQFLTGAGFADLNAIGLANQAELDALMAVEGPTITPEEARKTLQERFGAPPFSVIDARQGYWQNRKRAWIALGIRSELGRGECGFKFSDACTITRNAGTIQGDGAKVYEQRRDSAMGAVPPKQRDILKRGGKFAGGKRKPDARTFGQDLMRGEHNVGDPSKPEEPSSGASIFDPVLVELCVRWYAPPGGTVLDPFAGGSVRGIVSEYLGHPYTGVDLSARQLDANRVNAQAILPADKLPNWINGDSREIAQLAPGQYDLVFSCPPYGDLEVYSEDERDLSAVKHPAFLEGYRAIIAAAVGMLKPNRFAVFVVGDFRDKHGFYRNFPADTIAAFQAAGAILYNECILVTAVGSLPLRAARQFDAMRKLGKSHQNVLVFFKGDPKEIKTWPVPEFSVDLSDGNEPASPN